MRREKYTGGAGWVIACAWHLSRSPCLMYRSFRGCKNHHSFDFNKVSLARTEREKERPAMHNNAEKTDDLSRAPPPLRHSLFLAHSVTPLAAACFSQRAPQRFANFQNAHITFSLRCIYIRRFHFSRALTLDFWATPALMAERAIWKIMHSNESFWTRRYEALAGTGIFLVTGCENIFNL